MCARASTASGRHPARSGVFAPSAVVGATGAGRTAGTIRNTGKCSAIRSASSSGACRPVRPRPPSGRGRRTLRSCPWRPVGWCRSRRLGPRRAAGRARRGCLRRKPARPGVDHRRTPPLRGRAPASASSTPPPNGCGNEPSKSTTPVSVSREQRALTLALPLDTTECAALDGLRGPGVRAETVKVSGWLLGHREAAPDSAVAVPG